MQADLSLFTGFWERRSLALDHGALLGGGITSLVVGLADKHPTQSRLAMSCRRCASGRAAEAAFYVITAEKRLVPRCPIRIGFSPDSTLICAQIATAAWQRGSECVRIIPAKYV